MRLVVLIFTSLAPTLYNNEKNTQMDRKSYIAVGQKFKLTCMLMFATEKFFMHIILSQNCILMFSTTFSLPIRQQEIKKEQIGLNIIGSNMQK